MPAMNLVRLKRFELLTHGLEGRCSIQLSYRRVTVTLNTSAPAFLGFGAGDGNRTHAASLEGWNSTIELHPQSSHIGVASQRLYIIALLKEIVKNFSLFFQKKSKKFFYFF